MEVSDIAPGMVIKEFTPESLSFNSDGTTTLLISGTLEDGRHFRGEIPGVWTAQPSQDPPAGA